MLLAPMLAWWTISIVMLDEVRQNNRDRTQ